jgi:hypothetical protein
MSNLKVNTINDASGGSNAVLYGVAAPTNSMGFRNRIINGNMAIDQRNAGASVTPTNGAFTLDRWQITASQASKFSVQQVTTAPVGFTYSLKATSLSAYTVGASESFRIQQAVEGFNMADLGWGAAGAQAVTLSFRVYSSLTGTFGGSITDSATAYSYPFSYTVSVANTWTTITVNISGPTSGTWGTTNGVGLYVVFSLGAGASVSAAAGTWASGFYASATGATSVVGTNGATFYITGVQLEAGSVASPFEQIDYGRQLIQCQRYFEKSMPQASAVADGVASADRKVCVSYGSNSPSYYGRFMVTKRTTPTLTLYKGANTGTNGQWSYYSVATNWSTMTTGSTTIKDAEFAIDFGATMTANAAYIFDGQWTASAEL